MKIPYMDLTISSKSYKKELLEAVDRVLSHGRLIQGPELSLFEHRVCEYLSVSNCVGVGSGTDALFLSLKYFNIGPGDEVITTSLSWIATANAITLTGAKPVFVDIGDDLNIDYMKIEENITSKTKAIIPVHYSGKICEIEQILFIARKYNLYVIEDAAQAFGAKRDNRFAGSFGDMAAFSMNPMKILNSYGESGVIVFNNSDYENKLRSLVYNGTIDKENCYYPSINGRMDTIQAAMLLVNLKNIDKKIARRKEIALKYKVALRGKYGLIEQKDNEVQSYYNFILKTEDRFNLAKHLSLNGIETKVHYPLMMPSHKAYSKNYNLEYFPNALKASQEILSIPNHENLSNEEVDYIINKLLSF